MLYHKSQIMIITKMAKKRVHQVNGVGRRVYSDRQELSRILSANDTQRSERSVDPYSPGHQVLWQVLLIHHDGALRLTAQPRVQ